MKVKWLGHASFLITADNGTRVITDPYQSSADGGMVGYAKINESADVVAVSHEHGDHNYVSDVSGNPAVVRGVGSHQAASVGWSPTTIPLRVLSAAPTPFSASPWTTLEYVTWAT